MNIFRILTVILVLISVALGVLVFAPTWVGYTGDDGLLRIALVMCATFTAFSAHDSFFYSDNTWRNPYQ